MWNPPPNLRNRWIAHDFQLEHVAMDAFREGRLDRASLGLHEGRVDMRAFDTPPARPPGVRSTKRGGIINFLKRSGRSRWITLQNARLESIDFTHARLPGLTFHGVTFVDCLFDRADLDNTNFGACRLERCSFARAELSVVSLGHIGNPLGRRPLPSQFIDCRFDNATLGFTFSWGSEFTRCDFSRTRFRDTHWYGSRFVDCTFVGEIKGSEFRSSDESVRVPRRPDMLDGVDLSRTSLVECDFYGLNFDRTVFPNDNNHLVVQNFPCFLERAIGLLADHKTTAGEYTLRSMTRERARLGPAQRRGVINLRDVVDPWEADGQLELVAAFDQAMTECGQAGSLASRLSQPR
jgi:uncharacterized protein YjbI with pentapeptide repeats